MSEVCGISWLSTRGDGNLYLGGLVLAGGDKVCAVLGPLQVGDGLVELVDGDVVEEVAGLGVVLAHAAVLVAGDDVLVGGAPAGDGGLALVADDGEGALVLLGALGVGVDVEDDDVGEVAHALLRDAEDLGAVLAELDPLDGGGELPRLDVAARLDLPEADGVVRGARHEEVGDGIDVDGPDGADVAVVGADALAVVSPPAAGHLILGHGEEEVAIEVIPGTKEDMYPSAKKKKRIKKIPYQNCAPVLTVGCRPAAELGEEEEEEGGRGGFMRTGSG